MADRRSYLFALASSRRGGNAEMLARRAAESLDSRVEQRWINLNDVLLHRFEDRRHVDDGRYPPPVGGELELLDATRDATDVVVVSPLYWYSLSAQAKLYLDYWTAWLKMPHVEFRSEMSTKTLWGVASHTSPDETYVEPLVSCLRLSAQYLNMQWGGVLMGFGNRPGEILDDDTAVKSARDFFMS